MTTKKRMRFIGSYDTCDIANRHADAEMQDKMQVYENAVEKVRQSGKELTDDNIREQVLLQCYEDDDIYQWELDCLYDRLTSEMKKFNTNEFLITSSNFGWRNISDYKFATAETGEELLNATLPDCDCTFSIYLDKDSNTGQKIVKHGEEYNPHYFYIRNRHHDSPTGEGYSIFPLLEIKCECGCTQRDDCFCVINLAGTGYEIVYYVTGNVFHTGEHFADWGLISDNLGILREVNAKPREIWCTGCDTKLQYFDIQHIEDAFPGYE